MKILGFTLGAMAAVFAGQANAQYPADSWVIEQNTEYCRISHTFDDGTRLTLNTKSPEIVFFTLQNKAWQSLQDDKWYDIQVRFDNRGKWPARALAQTSINSDGPGLTFAQNPVFTGSSFLREFSASNLIVVTMGDREITAASLGGSSKATMYFTQCLRALGAVDPFRD